MSNDGLLEGETLGVPHGNHFRLDDKGPLVSGFLLWSLVFCSGVTAKGEGGPPEEAALPAPLGTHGRTCVHRGGEARVSRGQEPTPLSGSDSV